MSLSGQEHMDLFSVSAAPEGHNRMLTLYTLAWCALTFEPSSIYQLHNMKMQTHMFKLRLTNKLCEIPNVQTWQSC